MMEEKTESQALMAAMFLSMSHWVQSLKTLMMKR